MRGSSPGRCHGKRPFRSSIRLPTPNASAGQRAGIADAVANLEQISVRELMEQLSAVARILIARAS